MNIVNCSVENEIGSLLNGRRKFHSEIDNNYFSRRLCSILKENVYDLSKSGINKIFCTQWLDNKNVILGTKCNKVSFLKINIKSLFL